jgi:hypothetical protein
MRSSGSSPRREFGILEIVLEVLDPLLKVGKPVGEVLTGQEFRAHICAGRCIRRSSRSVLVRALATHT